MYRVITEFMGEPLSEEMWGYAEQRWSRRWPQAMRPLGKDQLHFQELDGRTARLRPRPWPLLVKALCIHALPGRSCKEEMDGHKKVWRSTTCPPATTAAGTHLLKEELDGRKARLRTSTWPLMMKGLGMHMLRALSCKEEMDGGKRRWRSNSCRPAMRGAGTHLLKEPDGQQTRLRTSTWPLATKFLGRCAPSRYDRREDTQAHKVRWARCRAAPEAVGTRRLQEPHGHKGLSWSRAWHVDTRRTLGRSCREHTHGRTMRHSRRRPRTRPMGTQPSEEPHGDKGRPRSRTWRLCMKGLGTRRLPGRSCRNHVCGRNWRSLWPIRRRSRTSLLGTQPSQEEADGPQRQLGSSTCELKAKVAGL